MRLLILRLTETIPDGHIGDTVGACGSVDQHDHTGALVDERLDYPVVICGLQVYNTTFRRPSG